MLTTNLRKWIVLLRDGRKIAITDGVYRELNDPNADYKSNDMITLTDPDTKKVLFNGKYGMINEYLEIPDTNMAGVNYVCDFGNRHHISEACDCMSKYKKYPTEFRGKAYELYGKKERHEKIIGAEEVTIENYETLYMGDLSKDQKINIFSHLMKRAPTS